MGFASLKPARTASKAGTGFTAGAEIAGMSIWLRQTHKEVRMRTIMVGALFAVAMVTSAKAAIKEEPVTYKDGETTLKGFVVYDDATQAKRPGIVMVHEWWGITKHIHDEARKFAEQGYTAF